LDGCVDTEGIGRAVGPVGVGGATIVAGDVKLPCITDGTAIVVTPRWRPGSWFGCGKAAGGCGETAGFPGPIVAGMAALNDTC